MNHSIDGSGDLCVIGETDLEKEFMKFLLRSSDEPVECFSVNSGEGIPIGFQIRNNTFRRVVEETVKTENKIDPKCPHHERGKKCIWGEVKNINCQDIPCLKDR